MITISQADRDQAYRALTTVFAIVGGPGTGKTTLARAMCDASSECYLADPNTSAAGIRNSAQKFVLLEVDEMSDETTNEIVRACGQSDRAICLVGSRRSVGLCDLYVDLDLPALKQRVGDPVFAADLVATLTALNPDMHDDAVIAGLYAGADSDIRSILIKHISARIQTGADREIYRDIEDDSVRALIATLDFAQQLVTTPPAAEILSRERNRNADVL
jgi:hypothetical protein